MQSKTLTKLILDIVITVLFIVLIDPHETGLTFHEIAGLSIGVMFIFHVILNWPWVKNVTKNLINPKMKSKTKFFYLLNSLSFIAVATIIITGVQISEVLFPTQSIISHTTVLVHKWVSYSCLVLFGLHLVLHWRFFVHIVPRMLRSPDRPPWSKIALNLGAVILVLALLYSQVSAGNANHPVALQEPQSTGDDNRPRPRHDRLPSANSESTGTGQYSEDTSISKDTGDSNTPSISSGTSNSSADNQVTLADYLSNMFCTGCDKHCSLLTPRCERGIPEQEAAKLEYQAIYSSATGE